MFEELHPQDILRWAFEEYGERLVVVTSFQPTGIVTLHMLSQFMDRIPVATLDTGLLFPETYALMNELEERFNLDLHRVQPRLNVEAQADVEGDHLWARNPDRCCFLRKTVPLRNALIGYEAWITGLRRDQSDRRGNTPIVSWDQKYGLTKLCPFATWTEDMIWTYIHAYELPYNTLHDQGFPSIGCWTCTRAVKEGEDMRGGRWSNHAKTECGIHVPNHATA